jgi:hypothetical protein
VIDASKQKQTMRMTTMMMMMTGRNEASELGGEF